MEVAPSAANENYRPEFRVLDVMFVPSSLLRGVHTYSKQRTEEGQPLSVGEKTGAYTVATGIELARLAYYAVLLG